jgi:hypothetical protein
VGSVIWDDAEEGRSAHEGVGHEGGQVGVFGDRGGPALLGWN